MIRAVILIGSLAALMASTRSFVGSESLESSGVALAFGFLLLAGLQVGNLFAAVRLPRLTGYLLTGLVAGPEVSGLLTAPMIESLGPINGVAVGLIALAAGSELNLRRLRPRLRSILLVSVIALPLAMICETVLSLVLAPHLPFLAGMSSSQRIAASVTLGVVFASLSPAVGLAILAETASAGPLSESVLGVVVLADIVIILFFAFVHAAAASVFASAGEETISPLLGIAIEVFGSIGVGVLVALALWAYIKRVKSKVALFVLAVCLVSAQVGSRLHLDTLIICLTAGLLLENFFAIGGDVITRELAPAVIPVFAVFFAVAGARLHVHELARMWPMALAFAVLRAVTLMLGARIGATIAGVEPQVKKWLPLGLLPQAGVSVGLAVLIERHFPTWGPGARSLILSVITMNELIGPVLLRMALVRAGEAGKREGGAEPAGDH